jgi:hypothetical protein
MSLTAWPRLARAPRCAACGRRIRRSAWAEQVSARTIGLCLTHAPTSARDRSKPGDGQ